MILNKNKLLKNIYDKIVYEKLKLENINGFNTTSNKVWENSSI